MKTDDRGCKNGHDRPGRHSQVANPLKLRCVRRRGYSGLAFMQINPLLSEKWRAKGSPAAFDLIWISNKHLPKTHSWQLDND